MTAGIVLITCLVTTSVAFVVYVIYDLKFSSEEHEILRNQSITFNVESVEPRPPAESYKAAAYNSLGRILRQITSWEWQQAVANAIASLKTSGTELVEVRHSFPRQMVLGKRDKPHTLSVRELEAAVIDYQLRTQRQVDDVWRDVHFQIESFLSTRDSIIEPGNINGSISTPVELRPKLREKLQEVRNTYSFVNDSEPLHEDQLIKILKSEGIDLREIHDLPLLSLFVEFPKNNQGQFAIVLRKNEVHQALREFLIAHELGHWFLHFDSGFAERFMGENYYVHSSPDWKPLELDANTFAMTVLFPTPYLAQRENYEGPLTPEKLLDSFTRDMPESVQDSRLRDNMLEYIGERLSHYRHYKDVILPVRMPVESVQEEDVDALLRLSENTAGPLRVNWVQMNAEFVITRVSQAFLDLFGYDSESIVNKLSPLDLVAPEERDALRKLFLHRRDRLKAVFYFTIIVTRYGERRRVAVHSFPVLRKSEYAGSIGYLILPEKVPADAFQPEAIHTT